MINTVVLQASTILRDWQLREMGPQEVENYIRSELAQKLADTILNEDLIQIYTNKDVSTATLTAQAKLKIIQE